VGEAAVRSKGGIEDIVARLAPRPPVPTSIRHVPDPPATEGAVGSAAPQDPGRQVIAPLSADTFSVQFTASRALCDKLREAQDLLRHRGPEGSLAAVIEKGLDLLIEKVKKERFAIVSKPRTKPEDVSGTASSREIPDAIKREVYERDQGQCTFTDDKGRRCGETSRLEFHHDEGFARTGRHEVDLIRLLCRPHHKLENEKLYGEAFMERALIARDVHFTRPGTGAFPALV
jgi:hypothetical protein